MKLWKITQHREHGRNYWTWSLLAADGTIDAISGNLADYGATIHDAVTHGFRPTEDHWIVQSVYYTTHYERGKRAVIVGENYKSGMTPSPTRPLKERRGSNEPSAFRPTLTEREDE
jgi:hypothetical protein